MNGGSGILRIKPKRDPAFHSGILISLFMSSGCREYKGLGVCPRRRFVGTGKRTLPFGSGRFSCIVYGRMLRRTRGPTRFVHRRYEITGEKCVRAPDLLKRFLFPGGSRG